MISDMKIRDRLMFTTIQIIADSASGTGFFFDLSQTKGLSTPVIITNKHVVENRQRGKIIFHVKDTGGNPILGKNIQIEIDNFESVWTFHPDPNVDLCCMSISEISSKNPGILYSLLDLTLIPNEKDIEQHKITAIEEVLVIGYPNSIIDTHNNLPITRKGITATHISYKFNGNDDFVIDAGIYPGSSGSPVFLQLPFYGRQSELSDWFYLVGIIHKVHNHLVVVEIPGTGKTIINIPNGLGIAVNASKIYDFVGLALLAKYPWRVK